LSIVDRTTLLNVKGGTMASDHAVLVENDKASWYPEAQALRLATRAAKNAKWVVVKCNPGYVTVAYWENGRRIK
jgi:hypothetical protein